MKGNEYRQVISSAFRRLLMNKSFSQISVADIAKESGIGRTTFYKHFKDKYDIIEYTASKWDNNIFESYTEDEMKSCIVNAICDNSVFLEATLKEISSRQTLNVFNKLMKHFYTGIDKAVTYIDEHRNTPLTENEKDILELSFYGLNLRAMLQKYDIAEIASAVDDIFNSL